MGPFNHKSGALTAELSPHPMVIMQQTSLAAVRVFVLQKQSRGSRSSSRSSSISVSIESALEAFDFLNTEDSPDDIEQSPV